MKFLKENRFYILLLVLSIVLPFFIPGYYFFQVIIMCCLFSICALSMNLILGYTGQPSLAHAGFFAIGAYGVAMMTKGGMPFWLALPLAALIASFIGSAIGVLALRTRGAYFSITTMCMGVIITLIACNWIDFTGGSDGISEIPAPTPIPVPFFGSIEFQTPMAKYYLALAFLVLTLFILNRLVYSQKGLTFMAVRDNEMLADATGINTFWAKLLSFAVSNFIAGLAGGLYASLIGSIGPELSSVGTTFNFLICILVGGIATLAGPVIGTFAMTLLLENLQFLKGYSMIIFGILLIVVIIFFPSGLMGGIDDLSAKIKQKLASRKAA